MPTYSVNLSDNEHRMFGELVENSDEYNTKSQLLKAWIREEHEEGTIGDDSDADDIDDGLYYAPGHDRDELSSDEILAIARKYDSPAINPAHIGTIPRDTYAKQVLLAGVINYESEQRDEDPLLDMEEDDLVQITRQTLGVTGDTADKHLSAAIDILEKGGMVIDNRLPADERYDVNVDQWLEDAADGDVCEEDVEKVKEIAVEQNRGADIIPQVEEYISDDGDNEEAVDNGSDDETTE